MSAHGGTHMTMETCRKNAVRQSVTQHFARSSAGKIHMNISQELLYPEIWRKTSRYVILREPLWLKRAQIVQTNYLKSKFGGKMPCTIPTTSIKHHAFNLGERTSSLWSRRLKKYMYPHVFNFFVRCSDVTFDI